MKKMALTLALTAALAVTMASTASAQFVFPVTPTGQPYTGSYFGYTPSLGYYRAVWRGAVYPTGYAIGYYRGYSSRFGYFDGWFAGLYPSSFMGVPISPSPFNPYANYVQSFPQAYWRYNVYNFTGYVPYFSPYVPYYWGF
ncbi:MAG: hypothetical protein C4297_02880 [Gemmataceae bacterium]|mgnify:CR=1 FL=1